MSVSDEQKAELLKGFQNGGFETDLTRDFLASQSDATPDSPEVSDERPERVREIEKEPLFIESGKGREQNIIGSLDSYLDAHPEFSASQIEGKRILVKVNLVDAAYPDACSSPEAAKLIIERLITLGASEIVIGDSPSGAGRENKDGTEKSEMEILDGFRTIGYDKIEDIDPRVRLVDLREELQDTGLLSESETGLPDLAQKFDSVIVLSLPKMHGEHAFTGCRKNLMGLLSQEIRDNFFHKMKKDGTPDEAIRRESMAKLVEDYLLSEPRTLFILDGYITMDRSEHFGDPRVTDFAIVTEDPYNADVLAVQKSFSPESVKTVTYIHDMPVTELPEGKIRGEVGEIGDTSYEFQPRIVTHGGPWAAAGEISPAAEEKIINPLLLLRTRGQIAEIGLSAVEKLAEISTEKAIHLLLDVLRESNEPEIIVAAYKGISIYLDYNFPPEVAEKDPRTKEFIDIVSQKMSDPEMSTQLMTLFKKDKYLKYFFPQE